MNNLIVKIGTGAYEYYLKPLPKLVMKSILTNWIGTTIALIIAAIVKITMRATSSGESAEAV